MKTRINLIVLLLSLLFCILPAFCQNKVDTVHVSQPRSQELGMNSGPGRSKPAGTGKAYQGQGSGSSSAANKSMQKQEIGRQSSGQGNSKNSELLSGNSRTAGRSSSAGSERNKNNGSSNSNDSGNGGSNLSSSDHNSSSHSDSDPRGSDPRGSSHSGGSHSGGSQGGGSHSGGSHSSSDHSGSDHSGSDHSGSDHSGGSHSSSDRSGSSSYHEHPHNRHNPVTACPASTAIEAARSFPEGAWANDVTIPGGVFNHCQGKCTNPTSQTLIAPMQWPYHLPGYMTQGGTGAIQGIKEQLAIQHRIGGYTPTTSDTADMVSRTASATTAALAQPNQWLQAIKEAQNIQTQQSADTAGDMEKQQAGCAIDFCRTSLENFTVDAENKWNTLRNQLFLPMAILLLLPGAIATQAKVTVAQGFPIFGEQSPFDGIYRSIISIFLIPGTYLIVNYGIDLSNSITYTISSEYQRTFGSDMYRDAMCAHIRAYAARLPGENLGYIPAQPGVMEGKGLGPRAKFEGKNVDVKLEDPCAHIYEAPEHKANEKVPYVVNTQRLGYNGMGAALAMTWTILCAVQMCYLYYLWFVGPIMAALWVWPMKQVRDAFPNWCEGVITICFWSLFWNTTILLMACCRGIDDTGTVIMTALLFLSTACVKFAFDFSGLVKSAGAEAGKMAAQAASGQGKGGKTPSEGSGKNAASENGVNGKPKITGSNSAENQSLSYSQNTESTALSSTVSTTAPPLQNLGNSAASVKSTGGLTVLPESRSGTLPATSSSAAEPTDLQCSLQNCPPPPTASGMTVASPSSFVSRLNPALNDFPEGSAVTGAQTHLNSLPNSMTGSGTTGLDQQAAQAQANLGSAHWTSPSPDNNKELLRLMEADSASASALPIMPNLKTASSGQNSLSLSNLASKQSYQLTSPLLATADQFNTAKQEKLTGAAMPADQQTNGARQDQLTESALTTGANPFISQVNSKQEQTIGSALATAADPLESQSNSKQDQLIGSALATAADPPVSQSNSKQEQLTGTSLTSAVDPLSNSNQVQVGSSQMAAVYPAVDQYSYKQGQEQLGTESSKALSSNSADFTGSAVYQTPAAAASASTQEELARTRTLGDGMIIASNDYSETQLISESATNCAQTETYFRSVNSEGFSPASESADNASLNSITLGVPEQGAKGDITNSDSQSDILKSTNQPPAAAPVFMRDQNPIGSQQKELPKIQAGLKGVVLSRFMLPPAPTNLLKPATGVNPAISVNQAIGVNPAVYKTTGLNRKDNSLFDQVRLGTIRLRSKQAEKISEEEKNLMQKLGQLDAD